MSKKNFLVICAPAVLIFALVTNRTNSNTPKVNVPPAVEPQGNDVPEDVRYILLFRHVSYLKKQAEKLRQQGKDGSGFERRFQSKLDIDADQFERLRDVAVTCEAEVTELDRKAEKIIDAFRAGFPAGEVPPGVTVPPPPPELLALQEERRQAILRARDRLKEKFGEREFTRVDEIIKLRLIPGINHAALGKEPQ